jgi:predicted DsbA family dithiol-disulfide isomerase
LNPGEVVLAAHSGRYDSVIDADAALAQRAGIRGTPGFSINGYFVSGAQRIEVFRKLVRRALEERRRGIRPKPNFPKAASQSP